MFCKQCEYEQVAIPVRKMVSPSYIDAEDMLKQTCDEHKEYFERYSFLIFDFHKNLGIQDK